MATVTEKVTMWKELSYIVTAYFRDYEPYTTMVEPVDAWKLAFYELWRYQMTFSFAYSIEMLESRDNGTFVRIVCKPSFVEPLLEYMDTCGYRKINNTKTTVGVIPIHEVSDEDVSDIFYEY